MRYLVRIPRTTVVHKPRRTRNDVHDVVRWSSSGVKYHVLYRYCTVIYYLYFYNIFYNIGQMILISIITRVACGNGGFEGKGPVRKRYCNSNLGLGWHFRFLRKYLEFKLKPCDHNHNIESYTQNLLNNYACLSIKLTTMIV